MFLKPRALDQMVRRSCLHHHRRGLGSICDLNLDHRTTDAVPLMDDVLVARQHGVYEMAKSMCCELITSDDLMGINVERNREDKKQIS
jgi:hypothetical protein